MPIMPTNQTVHFNRRDCQRRAFTLIEILIVIALTTVLFALLLIPLVSAIKYTRQAQSLTATQDAARITRERLTRELSSAVFVFDGTSHPFLLPAGTTPAAGDDLSTNFLDLDIPKYTGAAVNTTVPAHAYNAKLDFALPRVNDTGVVDPTTNEPIAYGQSGTGSAVIVSPSQVFPAAAGATMVRYWVGLKDPTQPYNNNREENADKTKTDNTYILYRAQFQPYTQAAAGGPTTYGPNTNLFATTANGKAPEIDDPDFFRTVTGNDINWLNAAHLPYTAAEVMQHNQRVEKWQSIAKPVIPGPNVDLILLPRNADNTINFDPTGGTFPGVAHSGSAHDPVTGNYYPIVNTSITFKPGTVSGDATPASTTDYNSAGVPLVDQTSGLNFIPAVYTAAAHSWSQPYKVTLTPPSAPANQVGGGGTYYTGQDPTTGDTVEYDQAGTTPVPATDPQVYDLTTAGPIGTAVKSYIPLSINADSGTISFDTPSFPNPANHYGREWVYTPTGALVNNVTVYTVDLTTLGGNVGPSPLGTIVDKTATASASTSIPTARLVPGSVRVYGPDGSPGPGRYQPGVAPSSNQPFVLYTEASQVGTGTPGVPVQYDNQYLVNYGNSTITLLGNADQFGAAGNPAPVRIVYDYQANMAPVGTGTVAAMTNPVLLPINVSVDYRTRDLIDISLGIRIYDLSTGRAQVIPSEFKAKIGNSNR